MTREVVGGASARKLNDASRLKRRSMFHKWSRQRGAGGRGAHGPQKFLLRGALQAVCSSVLRFGGGGRGGGRVASDSTCARSATISVRRRRERPSWTTEVGKCWVARKGREVLNRVHDPKPKATSGPPTYRKPKTAPAPTGPPAASNMAASAHVDPNGLQTAMDMLAALLPKELMASIQQQVKPRVVPAISRTRERYRLHNVVRQRRGRPTQSC